MLIRRINVRNFRKLLHGVEIGRLEPGLTVIAGDNEEGKSTLLKALQAAVFDRYNLSGQAVTEMLPFGSNVRPEIVVEFEIAETCYRLEKGFHQSPSALLESNGQRWQGDAAEEKLREILGFTPPRRGAAKEEHRGLSGLLWVEQGRGFTPLQLNDDTRVALQEAIEGEVGQVVGGERGRKLLAAVHEKSSIYFTPTGRRKGALKDAHGAVEALGAEVDSLENELAQYDAKVDILEKLKKTLTRYERERRLARAEDDVHAAQAKAKELEALENQITTAAADLKTAETLLKLAESTLASRKDKANRLQAIETEADGAGRAVADLDEELLRATAARDRADEKLKAARTAFETAQSKRVAAQHESKRAALTVELETLWASLDQAQNIEAGIMRDRQAAARIRITDEELDVLKKKETELGKQRAALEAVATTLVFSPSGNQSVRVDGQELAGGTPYRITEKTTLELQGFGGLDITPGGDDVRTRRSTFEALQDSLDAGLNRLGYDSVEAATTACREKNATRTDIKHAEARLDGVAPKGLDKLRAEVAGLKEELAAVTTDAAAPAATVEAARQMEEVALSEEAAASQVYTEADHTLKTEENNVSVMRERWTGAKGTFTQRRQEIERLRVELAKDREDKNDADLERGAAAADRRRDQCAASLKELEDRRDELSPDQIRAELERVREVYAKLQERIDIDTRRARDLEVELRTIGQKGLGEEIERQRGKLIAAKENLARYEFAATAWALLRDTLQAAEREAKEAFLAPVTERLQPYMDLVFPGTVLRLNEEGMEIKALHRRQVDEPFTSLSIGTREQIAVLARLAFADMLRKKGRPIALILDDALVNCDDDRFDRMAKALRKAAKNVQILILTCHEDKYQALGATLVRLMDCKAAGS